ncbi:MAG: hypothetical protein AAGM67_01025 [Bacteroidota bacterium]
MEHVPSSLQKIGSFSEKAIHLSHGLPSVEEMEEEYRKWVAGEMDFHDRFVTFVKKAVVSRHSLLKHLREEGSKHDLSSMQNALKFARSLDTILSLTAEQKLVLAKRLHKHCYRSDCSSFLTDPSRHPSVVSVIMGVV